MFYFSLANRPALKEVFSDLREEADVKVFDTPFYIQNKLLNFLFRAHMSKVINDRVYLPLKSLWKWSYSIEKEKIDFSTDNYLVIIDSALVWYAPDYINELQKKGMKLILLLFNPFEQIKKNKTFWNVFSRIKFDLMFSTFDIRDPKINGTVQTYSVYSKVLETKQKIKTDVFFLGKDKGRHTEIVQLYKALKKYNYLPDFNIIDYAGEERDKCTDISYRHEVQYSEYLDMMTKSRCILEIVQEGQCGITLRTFEAIVYNKHLLTNNKHVKEMPFYNPEYIHVYHNIDNLNFDFLSKNDKEVDYGYLNEFSPIRLKQEIVSKIKEKDRNGVC